MDSELRTENAQLRVTIEALKSEVARLCAEVARPTPAPEAAPIGNFVQVLLGKF